jgi:deoxycytidine triphosphate deaminase
MPMTATGWHSLDKDVKSDQGFLVDSEIAKAIGKGQLLVGADASHAKYACYEVHIGPEIHQLVVDETPGDEKDLYRIKAIPDDQLLRIKPGETYKIYAAEKLRLPDDVFALSVPVGNMYKLGLNPETTFADPGFSGDFYITICNYSPRVVKLKVGDPLARMFFFHLSGAPDRIHDSRPRILLPPSVERVPPPDLESLEKEGEESVLRRVLELVSSPHFDHAYVTQRLFAHYREQIGGEVRQLQRRAASLVIVNQVVLCGVAAYLLLTAGSFVRQKWPGLFNDIVVNWAAALLPFLALALIAPLRRAFMSAVATIRDAEANDRRR